MSLLENLKPSDWSQIVGNHEVREEFLKWLRDWRPQQQKKAAILYGPAGVGKTITVELAAKELGYKLTELNASDVRTREKLFDKLFPATKSMALTGKRNIIFLDEIDGLDHKKDAGGVKAVSDMIDDTAVPIVMTANDPWKPFLREIRNRSQLFELRKLRRESILNSLRKITNQKGLIVEQDALELIADRAEGDMRSAIMDLRSLASANRVLNRETIEKLLQKREREENVFQGIRNAIYSSDLTEAIAHLQSINIMPNELIDWIYGNITNIAVDVKSLFSLMRAISKADYLYALIWKRRDWALTSYIYYILSLGLMSCRRKGWIRLNMPKRVSQKWARISKMRARIEKAAELRKGIHERTSVIMTQIIPLINYIQGAGSQYNVKKEKTSSSEN